MIRIKKETLESKEHKKIMGKAFIYYNCDENLVLGFIQKVFEDAKLYDLKLLKYLIILQNRIYFFQLPLQFY